MSVVLMNAESRNGFLTETLRHGGVWAEKKVSIQTEVIP